MREATAPTAAPPRPSTARIPRTMSTQHPDNVAMPFFSQAATLTAEDEVREAYYAFSHLGCDEQMWDNEGKEVDAHVVEKLLTSYESYFAEHPIGESVFLTPRIPNPAPEPTQAKIALVEDREHLMAADDLVREYLRGKTLEHVRVFIARSDPALNYGYLAAVLLALIALDRLGALERESGVAVYPIIGVGCVPFRGG